jgi:hypothetical protein
MDLSHTCPQRGLNRPKAICSRFIILLFPGKGVPRGVNKYKDKEIKDKDKDTDNDNGKEIKDNDNDK